jgi:twitching motility protein PilT
LAAAAFIYLLSLNSLLGGIDEKREFFSKTKPEYFNICLNHSEKPYEMGVNILQLLKLQTDKGASDLHIASNSSPMIRINGEMVKVSIPPLTAEDVMQIVSQISSEGEVSHLKLNKSLDIGFTAKGIGIFRVNAFFQRHGLSIVFRALSEEPPNLEDLGMPDICKKACEYPSGLVLVTGPTGSGKSTTLAAMVDHINRNRRGHILTLEDPIEFIHETKLSMINQRSKGAHFSTFSDALKAALREDPDVILVGEMRDLETISLAIEASETGHLVFGTLHTGSAAKSVDRIINVFPGDTQAQIRTVLSESLKLVISQKLIPTADRKKRVCVQDIMVNTHGIANLIREAKIHQIESAMQTGKLHGMQIFDNELHKLVGQGIVDGTVAWGFANEKSKFKQWEPAGHAMGDKVKKAS